MAPPGPPWIRQCADISFIIVCLFAFLFAGLRISPPRINLAAANFAQRFIGVQIRESSILGNFAPPEAQSDKSASARATPTRM